MKKSRLILGLVVLAALAAIVIWGHGKIHFDFAVFRSQLAHVSWREVGIAIGCIYIGYILRSMRWALLMKHNQKVSLLSLLGTQVIGFTAVALIGRVADLTRPYLVARKTGQPLGSQFAVYIVERLFDAGAMALLLSAALFVLPMEGVQHLEILNRGKHWFLTPKYSFLTFTVLGALFMVLVRMAGGMVASFFEALFGLVSKKIGHAVGNKIRSFHTGLDTIRSFADFGAVSGLSLVMWFLILMAYFETAHAFVTDPKLASMSLAKCMLVLACSGAASFLQLPVLGWFTQIGIVGEVIHDAFDVVREAAWACSAMLLIDTFLSVLPVGLVWAQFEHVNLREVAVRSEKAGEQIAVEQAAEPAKGDA